MDVSGIVTELDLTDVERAIKIHVRGVAKPVWVAPEYQPDVKGLQLGEQVSFEVREGRDYYFYQAQGERTSANVSQPDTSPQMEQKPPKPPKSKSRSRDCLTASPNCNNSFSSQEKP